MTKSKIHLCYLLLFLLLNSCTTDNKTNHSVEKPAAITEKKSVSSAAAVKERPNNKKSAAKPKPKSTSKNAAKPTERPENMLKRIVARRPFSHAKEQDLFQLDLVGDKALNGQLKLTIIAHSGKILHQETLPSKVLLHYGQWQEGADKNNEIEQEKHILQQMSYQFFDRKQFSTDKNRQQHAKFMYKTASGGNQQLYYDDIKQKIVIEKL